MAINRRDFLKQTSSILAGLATVGLGSLTGLAGCAGGGGGGASGISAPQQTIEQTIAQKSYYKLVDSPEKVIVDSQQYKGYYTSVSQVGNYLTGTLTNETLRGKYSARSNFPFSFVDKNRNVINPEVYHLSPSFPYGQGSASQWVIPLQNLLSNGPGPYTLASINYYKDDEDTGTISITEVVNFSIPLNLTKVHNALPQNTAPSHRQNNAQALADATSVLVRYIAKPVILSNRLGEQKEISPITLSPLHAYENDPGKNNDLVHRASRLYVHGTQVFKVSPLEYVNQIIIDEIMFGLGQASSDGLLRARVSTEGADLIGINDNNEQLAKDMGFMLVDVHELTHFLDFFNRIPSEQQFKSLSFDIHGNLLPDATLDEFVSLYAKTDPIEDLAETSGFAVVFGENVRLRARVNQKLRQKYDFVSDGILGGKEFTVRDIQELAEKS
ncbi:MAG TPA: hypothetical protein VI894_04000 [Candidatus Nanoarchaeia archaeon]|nr:hypothetical protein [Candidatus Nanoarchaeia archaeon]